MIVRAKPYLSPFANMGHALVFTKELSQVLGFNVTHLYGAFQPKIFWEYGPMDNILQLNFCSFWAQTKVMSRA